MSDPVTLAILVGLGFLAAKKTEAAVQGQQPVPPPTTTSGPPNSPANPDPLGLATGKIPAPVVTDEQLVTQAVGASAVAITAGLAPILGGSAAGAAIGAVAGAGIAEALGVGNADAVTKNIIAPGAGAVAGAAVGSSAAAAFASGGLLAAGAVVAPAATIVMMIIAIAAQIEETIHDIDDENQYKKLAKMLSDPYTAQNWHDAWASVEKYYKDNNRLIPLPQYAASWGGPQSPPEAAEFQRKGMSSCYPLKDEYLLLKDGTKINAIEILEYAYSQGQESGDKYADLLNDCLPWYGHRPGYFRRNLASAAAQDTIAKLPQGDLWKLAYQAFRNTDSKDFPAKDRTADTAMHALDAWNVTRKAVWAANSGPWYDWKPGTGQFSGTLPPQDLMEWVASKTNTAEELPSGAGMKLTTWLDAYWMYLKSEDYGKFYQSSVSHIADMYSQRPQFQSVGVSITQLTTNTSSTGMAPISNAVLASLGFTLKR